MKPTEILALIDHTRLEDNDSDDVVAKFCQEALTPIGNCAAVCVYPKYVSLVKNLLKNTPVQVASVANFPEGNNNFQNCLAEIELAFAAGADEIDIVLPYRELIRGNDFFVNEFVKACRRYDNSKKVKIIIESGALTTEQIKKASQFIIDAEIEFIKTSTGKIPQGASPQAVQAILETIKENKGTKTGLKISGGVRSIADADSYLAIVEKIMGANWISPNSLRFGSSKLVQEILKLS